MSRRAIIWLALVLVLPGLHLAGQAAAAPAGAWHMIVVPAEADVGALQAWLARRGVDAHVAELVLAAELTEADVAALVEQRAEVIEVRAPEPEEPVMREWAPVVRGAAGEGGE